MNCINFTSPEPAVVVDNPSTFYLYCLIGVRRLKDCRRLGLSVEIKNTHKLRVVFLDVFFVLPESELRPEGEPQQPTTCKRHFDQYWKVYVPLNGRK